MIRERQIFILQLISFILIFLFNDKISAASFNCSKAQAIDEKLICMTDKLSKQDEDVAKLYKSILENNSDNSQIKRNQKEALKIRRECQNVSCIESWFDERLKYLHEITGKSLQNNIVEEQLTQNSSANNINSNNYVVNCDNEAANPNDEYKKNQGIKFDDLNADKAIALCTSALENVSEADRPRITFQLGRSYYKLAVNKNDFSGYAISSAITNLEKAADSNYAIAASTLGFIFEDLKDYNQAKKWHQKALEMGSKIAQKDLLNLSGNNENEQFISEYKNRKRTILEQVLNFSEMGVSTASSEYGETGGTIGKNYFHVWISGYKGLDKCILTKYSYDPTFFPKLTEITKVDLREVNETAFQFKPKYINGEIVYEIGDGKFSIISEALPLDRLQKAWKFAFQECPGKKTSF